MGSIVFSFILALYEVNVKNGYLTILRNTLCPSHAAIFTALLSWKLSGEVFSETKFLRLVLASFALALGFNISGTPLANVAVNPFASALAGLLFSKGLNYIKEVPTQLLSQIEGIVTEASKQIPSFDPTPASATTLPLLPIGIPFGIRINFFLFLGN